MLSIDMTVCCDHRKDCCDGCPHADEHEVVWIGDKLCTDKTICTKINELVECSAKPGGWREEKEESNG